MLAALLPSVRAAAAASSAAQVALDLCHRAAFEYEATAMPLLEAGIDRAEAAVAGEPDDPVAHFALFCNLARRMQLQGFSWRSWVDLRRAHRALDRSLALAPAFSDALAAKGALLYYTPRLAGGDIDAGERLIREALAIDPDNPVRLVLVELLAERQAIDEARHEAVRSLAALRASTDPTVRAGARALLDRLCTRQWPGDLAAILLGEC